MDLGCGDGILAAVIVGNDPSSTAILADHSPPMLEAAREKLQGLHGSAHFCPVDYSNAEWIRSIAQHSPFDLVVSGFSIHHQPDERKRQIYSEIFDLLEPGGMFVNMEHVASSTPRISELWDRIRIDAFYDFSVQRGEEETKGGHRKRVLRAS